MEKSLFKRLTDSMEQFNTGALFDIPTGTFNGGLKPGEFAVHAALPNKTGPNYALIDRLFTELERFSPNTYRRRVAAVNLLRVMGYSVTWEDEKTEPAVHWINTEGNGDAEAKMIEDIFERDYRTEPRIDVSHLNGSDFYAAMKSILNGESTDGKVITIDSITQESTDPT